MRSETGEPESSTVLVKPQFPGSQSRDLPYDGQEALQILQGRIMTLTFNVRHHIV